MLINPNGVAITPKGVVKTGSFTASTLNIKNKHYETKYIHLAFKTLTMVNQINKQKEKLILIQFSHI